MKALGTLLFLAASVASGTADLVSAADYSAAHGESALLVSGQGHILFERGAALVEAPRVFSITKSLVSLGVFRGVRAGIIPLDHAVSDGPARGITIDRLMNQTSGLEPMSGAFYSEGLRDKARVLSGLPTPRAERGFAYGASHWEVLAEEISRAAGMPVDAWLRRFVPGARSQVLARWRRDGAGRVFFSTGARLSARELLPAGRGVIEGFSRGRHRWPDAVTEMLSSGTRENGMYALGFWLNRRAGGSDALEIDVERSLGLPRDAAFWRNGCLSRRAPSDLLAMIGTGGQRVYVVPSRGLVIVRLGAGRFSDAEFLGRYFAGPLKARAERG